MPNIAKVKNTEFRKSEIFGPNVFDHKIFSPNDSGPEIVGPRIKSSWLPGHGRENEREEVGHAHDY